LTILCGIQSRGLSPHLNRGVNTHGHLRGQVGAESAPSRFPETGFVFCQTASDFNEHYDGHWGLLGNCDAKQAGRIRLAHASTLVATQFSGLRRRTEITTA
jgi:hypothetical protein